MSSIGPRQLGLIVNARPLHGTPAPEAIRDAIALARRLGCWVACDVYGVALLVNEASDAEAEVAAWERQRGRRAAGSELPRQGAEDEP